MPNAFNRSLLDMPLILSDIFDRFICCLLPAGLEIHVWVLEDDGRGYPCYR
jgi:hypothetical protein